VARLLDETLEDGAPARELDVAAAYDEHADLVWKSLHRLGVRTADVPDLVHEVFLVLHRRRGEWEVGRPLGPWLWGICVGLARNYRRRAFRRAELGAPEHEGRSERDAEGEVDARRRMERGRRALEELDPERRAVFVMFEVEGMSGREIAEVLGVAIGTVHSRLHAARRELAAALAGAEEET
jgi:RNA polymerase sigma-70 factor (ECF subfamily)